MTFRYEPLVGGDLFEAAQRFARERDEEGLVIRDRLSQGQRNAEVWDAINTLGWPLSLVPEDAGGVGGSLEDALALIEGSARFALPTPLAKSLVVAPHLLDTDHQRMIAEGTMVCGPVLDGAYPWSSPDRDLRAMTLSDRRLSGQVLGTEVIPGATHLAVAVGSKVAIVPMAHIESRMHLRVDSRLAADLSFDGIPVEALLPGDTVAYAIELAALCACVEIVAGAATIIEDSVDYLNERHQFGVPLSSFQVLRHYVADMFIAYRNAHAVTASAIRAALAGEALKSRAIALAKLRVGEVGRLIAETAIQVHGGMGMTEENRTTRVGKRLLMADLEWGDRAWQAQQLQSRMELAV